MRGAVVVALTEGEAVRQRGGGGGVGSDMMSINVLLIRINNKIKLPTKFCEKNLSSPWNWLDMVISPEIGMCVCNVNHGQADFSNPSMTNIPISGNSPCFLFNVA